MTPDEAARVFVEEATRLGFHRVGFAPVAKVSRHAVYQRWIEEGLHGEMAYLADDAAARADPRALLEGARGLVTVALSYARRDPEPEPGPPRGFVARYARGADYHMVLKRRLALLAEAASVRLGRPVAHRACVDTAPLLERELAHAGGVGFLAKSTMIIAPGLGSWLLLGELLVDVELPASAPAEPKCGQCRACLDACPTGAIVAEQRVDARRCISYWTIEQRGAIPRALRPLIADMVFGCDRCQEVCPFNAAAPDGDPAFTPGPHARPPLADLVTIGAARFRKLVRRTALRRIHRAQLQRNAAVALGNVGGAAEVPALARALADPSPLVRGHAAWALGRIAARLDVTAALEILVARRAVEEDPGVRDEIVRALAEAAPKGAA